jgi:hypothetical protein
MDRDFDRFVLESMPHFIAIEYKRLLDAKSAKEKIRHALRVYELGIRALALGIVSQYLIRDAERVIDPGLNHLLLTELPHATLDIWQEILFSTLRAYKGLRHLFFMPEYYDFFWDSSTTSSQPHPDIQVPFTRLTQIRNDLEHGEPPSDETGWETLCDETIELLHTVLSHFAFLKNYDLIRITKKKDNLYWYDRHTGLKVVPAQNPLRAEEELNLGWFYLSKDNCGFLNLHPLLIFWEDPSAELAPSSVPQPQEGTAVYDHFVHDRLQYLVANLWATVTDGNSVTDFVRLVYYTIQEIKQEHQEAERLTWWRLQEMAHAISQRRMASVLGKYRADLYVQRDLTQVAFEDFLSSDKICFILTGKSGVGKSNFLLAQSERYAWDPSSDVCLLMYNGAKMNPDEPLSSVIGRDFENRLQLPNQEHKEGIPNIWREIDQIRGIDKRKVVLFIDAINENPEGKALLRRIDELVEGAPWTWLKVVLTSRPQAWRTIKRGVQLSEARYYREAGESRVGVEMEPFTYSQELRPFTWDEELPRAYVKYCEVYNLSTAYEDLSYEVRSALQDPLVLRLVADTYQEGKIPATVQAEKVYQQYIDHLLESGRVTRQDLRFLEHELMPIMIQEGHYNNALTAQDIDQATTSGGKSLFELIHSGARLSSGRRVNQGYVNLVDAEILIQHGKGQDYDIRFKYERFYDHYAGKRLVELNQEKRAEEIKVAYTQLVGEIRAYPFLWGAVRNALLRELRTGKEGLIIDLCYTEEQALKEMMVAVLSAYGKEEIDVTKRLLKELIKTEHNEGLINQFFRKGQNVGLREKSAKKIAIEIAEYIGDCQILSIAARDSNPSVRTHAARYIYHLWKRDASEERFSETRNRGLQVLESLIPHLRNRVGLPNAKVWKSSLGIGFPIFMDTYQEYSESSALDEFQKICRKGFSKLLNIDGNRKAKLIQARIRNWVLSVGVDFVVNWLVRLPKYSAGNARELAAFFDLPQKDKDKVLKLIPYDSSVPLDLLRDELFYVAQLENMIATFAACELLILHGQSNPEEVCEIVEWLFNKRLEDAPESYFAHKMLSVLSVLMRQGMGGKKMLDLYHQLLDRRLQMTSGRTRTRLSTYIIPALHEYLNSAHAIGIRNLGWIHKMIEQAIMRNDTDFLLAVIWEFAGLGMSDEYYQLVLRSITPLIAAEAPDVRQAFWNLLARMRQRYPNEVDDFLAEHISEAVIRRRITSMEAEERISDLLFVPTEAFLHDYALRPSLNNSADTSSVTQVIDWALVEAVECKDIGQWVTAIGKKIVNLAYGSEAFDL